MIHETIHLCADDENVTLKTYLYDTRKKKSDAVLIIPGGGYQMVCGDREGEDIAMALSVEGFRTFVLNYSTKEKAKFPRPLVEASLAMAHIRENAEKYGVDPARVFVLGFSAGGHLAGSLGTMWHKECVWKTAGIEYGANRPTGMVLCYPVLCYFDKTHKGTFNTLFGTTEPTEEQIGEWSVERNVDERTCPAFLWHTSTDNAVNILNNVYMQQALAEHNIPFEAHIFPKGPHGMALANEITAASATMIDNRIAEWPRLAAGWMRSLVTEQE